eukprot:68599-Amphidinium_carterae.1
MLQGLMFPWTVLPCCFWVVLTLSQCMNESLTIGRKGETTSCSIVKQYAWLEQPNSVHTTCRNRSTS